MDPYEALANEIILQAVKDYRRARRRKSEKARWTVDEVKRFFLSRWFPRLTQIDGEELLRRLEDEYDSKRVFITGISDRPEDRQ